MVFKNMVSDGVWEEGLGHAGHVFKKPPYIGARGLPARLILSLGAMGWGVGQDSRILPAPSLRILEFGNFVPGSVAYVELVDA